MVYEPNSKSRILKEIVRFNRNTLFLAKTKLKWILVVLTLFQERGILGQHMAIKHALQPKHVVGVFLTFQPLAQPVKEEWYL